MFMPQSSLFALALALGSITVSAAQALAAPPAPEIFAPGVVSGHGNDADPAFTCDGRSRQRVRRLQSEDP
jgi:hypothetical protein